MFFTIHDFSQRFLYIWNLSQIYSIFSCLAVLLSAKICQENIEINNVVEIDIAATCKFGCNLLGAISGGIGAISSEQYWGEQNT